MVELIEISFDQAYERLSKQFDKELREQAEGIAVLKKGCKSWAEIQEIQDDNPIVNIVRIIVLNSNKDNQGKG